MNRSKTIFAVCGLVLLMALAYFLSQPARVAVRKGNPPKQLTASSTVQSLQLSGAVDALAFMPSGEEFLVHTKSRDGDTARHVLKCRMDNATSTDLFATNHSLFGLVLSPNGKVAYTGQWRTGPKKECEVLHIDVDDGRVARKFVGPSLDGFGFRITSDPTALEVSPDGRSIAVGTKLVDDQIIAGGHIGGEICVWNIETGEVLWRNRTVHTNIVRTVVYSPDGKQLFSAGEDSLIRVWDADSGELLRTLVGVLWGGIRSMQISPDGRYLATGGQGTEEGGRVRVWDLKENVQVQRFSPFRPSRSVHVTFCANGTLVAAGETKASTNENPRFNLRVWQADTFAPCGSVGDGTGFVRALVSAPSGTTVAVGTWEGEVLEYDFAINVEQNHVMHAESGLQGFANGHSTHPAR